MKDTKELLGESRERAKARFAERKEIESRSLNLRLEVQRANEEIGQHAMGAVTSEALSTRRAGDPQGRPGDRDARAPAPQIDDLARELGELAALLQVREVLTRKEG